MLKMLYPRVFYVIRVSVCIRPCGVCCGLSSGFHMLQLQPVPCYAVVHLSSVVLRCCFPSLYVSGDFHRIHGVDNAVLPS